MSEQNITFLYKYFVSFWSVTNKTENRGCIIVPFTREIKCMEDLNLLCKAIEGAYGYDRIVPINFIRL